MRLDQAGTILTTMGGICLGGAYYVSPGTFKDTIADVKEGATNLANELYAIAKAYFRSFRSTEVSSKAAEWTSDTTVISLPVAQQNSSFFALTIAKELDTLSQRFTFDEISNLAVTPLPVNSPVDGSPTITISGLIGILGNETANTSDSLSSSTAWKESNEVVAHPNPTINQTVSNVIATIQASIGTTITSAMTYVESMSSSIANTSSTIAAEDTESNVTNAATTYGESIRSAIADTKAVAQQIATEIYSAPVSSPAPSGIKSSTLDQTIQKSPNLTDEFFGKIEEASSAMNPLWYLAAGVASLATLCLVVGCCCSSAQDPEIKRYIAQIEGLEKKLRKEQSGVWKLTDFLFNKTGDIENRLKILEKAKTALRRTRSLEEARNIIDVIKIA